jgi:putative acetyltransferase
MSTPLPTLTFRPETPADVEVIDDLTARPFAPMAFFDGTEPQVIKRLRARQELTLSLFALDGAGQILGHVAFSQVHIPGQTDWYGLGPISVEPAHQLKGIGRAMVKEAITQLRHLGARGIALVGNPAAYGPMGFVSLGHLSHGDLPPHLVQHMTLSGNDPLGELCFSSAFADPPASPPCAKPPSAHRGGWAGGVPRGAFPAEWLASLRQTRHP